MNDGQAWLNYRKVSEVSFRKYLTGVYFTDEDDVIRSGLKELIFAIGKMYTVTLPTDCGAADSGIHLRITDRAVLGQEGYHIHAEDHAFVIEGNTSRGILYGIFQLLRRLQAEAVADEINEQKVPDQPLRMLNHWDNMDGSIERGYSGQSFFFQDNEVIVNERTADYARLVASIGINGVVINNVNVKHAATYLITPRYLGQLRKMQQIYASYGIKLFLSLNFAAPIELGGLSTADPLSGEVKTWWQDKLEEVFRELPGFGGFLIKADSEGRPGPFTYGRTHADGANMLAELVEPYGALIIWRCFVYNCQQDWRDRVTDRARAGYDHFKPLDGTFRGNVILQIKNGPMDFQVREPVSPLFGGLTATNQILEVQIAQEYTGQQRHVCYLVPMFKEILGFHTSCAEQNDTVADIVSGKTFGQVNCGMAAVANTGNDPNWTGHDLAAANFYGFGRLSFDTKLSAEEIASEWISLTFGNDPEVKAAVLWILMNSWKVYEHYTSPLGIGWMVNPNHHYGPNVDGYEYDRWGTYHRADHRGIGVDRSSKGTGYSTQYREPHASRFESIETCPEELLLFFHYVEYTYRLSNGKTLIQHIYDTHFEGVEEVDEMVHLWQSLEGKVEPASFENVKSRLSHQQQHSREWRDIVNAYFFRKSGIADELNRPIF
ncbi:alpha-glucuronidase family glycosyl hydrolase [Gorillibacterium massiliense]|uniref:alpha-glucuronidase family glycosyl hydrolase n=1 Tax=Gorillibacterium massiliense TaxID=1280390 RepID=UPI0004AE6302|nr:alpha-glucuronidase family glycosyl hydrolase [Gorillibacterium massiliense]